MEPFDRRLSKHSWTSDKLQKKPQQKQPEQLSIPIPALIASLHVQLSLDGEKCVRHAVVCVEGGFSQIGHIV